MGKITFNAPVITIGQTVLIHLPKASSLELPSRGMTMVKGTISDIGFQSPLEPDGKGSHWLKLDAELQKRIDAHVGKSVTVSIEATKDWPEPIVPKDLLTALQANNRALKVWNDITPMARWDWIRWINATKNPATRERRIAVTLSKLGSSKRRPCCFNRSECTDPSVSKNGILLETA